MRTVARLRTRIAIAGAVLIAGSATLFTSAAAPQFFDDDPIRIERDTQNAAAVTPAEPTLFSDLAYNVIKANAARENVHAQNVNTIDEVPDSSWFTNRIGARVLTPEEVAVGPNTTDGPTPGGWTVVSSKSDGVTPGLTIVDAGGERWFLKFDPRGYRGMMTGTEVSVSKLMWALGYHVPENHIAYFRLEQLAVAAGAKFQPRDGTARRMRQSDISDVLEHVEREPDGTYRVVASRALSGKPVGRIKFFGTRPDDPNDIVPHQHRRELRGYGVFAAWLNHVDAKAINSLDTLVTENGRSVVRHHLIDFGSALGSAGVAPADYWEGDEYLVQPGLIGKQMIALGFSIPKWRTERFYEASAIGRLPMDNSGFDPQTWKPRVPNQAFLHARADDKFWAARKLAALDTDLIRAAVNAGRFDAPEATDFLVRALAERRDAVARTYLTAINPIADPMLSDDGTLSFTNAAVEADVAHAPAGYRIVWAQFDNATRDSVSLGETWSRTTSSTAPAGLPTHDGVFLRLALSAAGSAHAAWAEPVAAYFRMREGHWRLIGFERMPAAE